VTTTETKDPLYDKLLGVMDECSGETEEGCNGCPAQRRCEKWWNTIVERNISHYIRPREYARYKAKFDIIRANKNGHKETDCES
jgi:hypothetical protein